MNGKSLIYFILHLVWSRSVTFTARTTWWHLSWNQLW